MKWLILSHAFNLDGRAESLTVTDKILYLLEEGVEPIIISSVGGNRYKYCRHYQLFPWGPSAIFFDLRHWYQSRFRKNYFYRLMTFFLLLILFPFQILERLFIGLTSQWSWSLPAAWRGYRLIRKHKIKVIYSSGGAWSAHYAAWILKKITGVQWLAEIHDPIVMRDEEQNTKSSKYREKNFLKKLENKICADADTVVWFTQSALNYAKQRNPILAEKGVVVYPGSFPPGCEKPLPPKHQYTEILSIGHFGSLSNHRSLAFILNALELFFQQVPAATNKIKLEMYGAPLDKKSNEVIQKLNMEHVVNKHGFISREVAFEKMKMADILLLQHGHDDSCIECLPSKIYDYYWSNRPIIALYDNNPDLDKLLENRKAYRCSTMNQDTILLVLYEIWDDWKNKKLRQSAFEPIHAHDAAQKFIEIVKKKLK